MFNPAALQKSVPMIIDHPGSTPSGGSGATWNRKRSFLPASWTSRDAAPSVVDTVPFTPLNLIRFLKSILGSSVRANSHEMSECALPESKIASCPLREPPWADRSTMILVLVVDSVGKSSAPSGLQEQVNNVDFGRGGERPRLFLTFTI